MGNIFSTPIPQDIAQCQAELALAKQSFIAGEIVQGYAQVNIPQADGIPLRAVHVELKGMLR